MLNGLRRLPERRFHLPQPDRVDRVVGGVFVCSRFTYRSGPLLELGIAAKGRGVLLKPRRLVPFGVRLIWPASMTNDPDESNYAS